MGFWDCVDWCVVRISVLLCLFHVVCVCFLATDLSRMRDLEVVVVGLDEYA